VTGADPRVIVRALVAACAFAAVPALANGTNVAPPAAPVAETESDALVRTAFDAPKRISYVGQLQTIRWGNRIANATIQRIEHLAPGRTRRTFLAPEALYGEYDVTVGETTTKIDPRDHRAIVEQNPASENSTATNTSLSLLEANYRAILGPVEVVAARPATTVALVNKYTGERIMKLWIDNDTKIVLAKEAYHADGSLAWRTRFDDIRFTSEIPPDIFSLDTPPGFQSIAGRHFANSTVDEGHALDEAGFKPVIPHYLPNGFSEVGADVATIRTVRNLHVIYSDGIRGLSLFENDTDESANFDGLRPATTHFAGHEATYVRDGPTTLLAWHDHGLAFALVGDLDIRELTQIAISVEP
jgi:outer membrane lipoprotein-sorting protein